jgi:hypothetical protein
VLTLWYLDRATALVAYPALYLAVLTGIPFNAPAFGAVHAAARRVHLEVATFALIVTLAHGALGLADAWLVASGQVPPPAYPMPYFLAGVIVGGGALTLVVVAVLGFLDARRFRRPWGPRVVHAFAYGGFAFASVHAVAIGTDVTPLFRVGVVVASGFVVYLLFLRLLDELGWAVAATGTPEPDQ